MLSSVLELSLCLSHKPFLYLNIWENILYIFPLTGSMPPDSHSIFEEGAVFKSFKIVKGGVFQEEGTTLLVELGTSHLQL